jgi:hypothetical protein
MTSTGPRTTTDREHALANAILGEMEKVVEGYDDSEILHCPVALTRESN